MNLSPLTVSFTATVAPTAAIAITVPSLISVDIEGVLPLSATIGVSITPLYMSLLDFSYSGVGGCEVGGAAHIVGDPLIWVGSGGAQVGGAASVPVTYSMTGSGGVQVGGAATVGYYALAPTLAVSFPPLSVSMTGDFTTMAVRFPALKVLGTGIQGNVGAMNVRFPALRPQLVAGVQVMDVVLPPLRVAAAGKVGQLGALSMQLPRLQVAMAAPGVFVGSMAVRFPAMREAATAVVGRAGNLGVKLYPLQVAATGQPSVIGQLAVTLSPIAPQLKGYSRIQGAMAVTFPGLVADLEGVLQAQLQLFLVANTKTQAPSTYEGLDVNSMIFFNGQTLFADATGVHVVDAADDNGTSIDAEVTFGKLDLGSRVQKRVPEAFIGLRADGDMSVEVSVDEQPVYAYTLATESVDRLKERRAKLGRGLKGMYWQLSVKNIEGCDFSIDKIELPVQDNDRKI